MAVALDTASASIGSGPSDTTAFTVGAGSDRLLLVHPAWFDQTFAPGTVSGVTWNGIALTQVPSAFEQLNAGGGVTLAVDAWYLVNPDTGAHNVVVNWQDGSNDVNFTGISSWNGVDATVPLGTAVTNSGASGNGSVVVSSAAGEIVAGVIMVEEALGADVASGDTQLFEIDNADFLVANGAQQNGAASVTLDWTLTSASGWAANGVPLKPAGGGGGGPTITYPMLERGVRGLERGLALGGR